jgi:hypothetical protein
MNNLLIPTRREESKLSNGLPRRRAALDECGQTRGLGSLVSFSNRNNSWGDPRCRGNYEGSLFKQLVLHYQPARVMHETCLIFKRIAAGVR